jgi:hypothetical protein
LETQLEGGIAMNDPGELWNFYTTLFETLIDVSFGAALFGFDSGSLDATPENVPYAGEEE